MLYEYDLVAKIRLRLGASFAVMIIVVIIVVIIQREKMTTKLRTEVAETAGNDNSTLLSRARPSTSSSFLSDFRRGPYHLLGSENCAIADIVAALRYI